MEDEAEMEGHVTQPSKKMKGCESNDEQLEDVDNDEGKRGTPANDPSMNDSRRDDANNSNPSSSEESERMNISQNTKEDLAHETSSLEESEQKGDQADENTESNSIGEASNTMVIPEDASMSDRVRQNSSMDGDQENVSRNKTIEDDHKRNVVDPGEAKSRMLDDQDGKDCHEVPCSPDNGGPDTKANDADDEESENRVREVADGDLPSTTSNDEECSGSKCNEDGSRQDEAEDDDEEEWEVKKIMSIQDLKECPIVCSGESCRNVAAMIYVSNLAPTEKWYSCLDCQVSRALQNRFCAISVLNLFCQEDDFGGWPDLAELPLSFMSEEHMTLMRAKCSKRKKVAMPTFPPQTSANSPIPHPKTSHTVTPVPQSGSSGSNVRPSSNANDVTPMEPKPKNRVAPKPSKEALAIHKKWQEQAEAMGGKDARIIVSKPDAKKLIFELLHDAFRPMNITQVHKVSF